MGLNSNLPKGQLNLISNSFFPCLRYFEVLRAWDLGSHQYGFPSGLCPALCHLEQSHHLPKPQFPHLLNGNDLRATSYGGHGIVKMMM